MKQKSITMSPYSILGAQAKNGQRALLIALNYLLITDYVNKTDYITSFFLQNDKVIYHKKAYYDGLINLYDSIKENGYHQGSPIIIARPLNRIIDGAHRVAICLFLRIESIECVATNKLFVKNGLDWFYDCGFSDKKLVEMSNQFECLLNINRDK